MDTTNKELFDDWKNNVLPIILDSLKTSLEKIGSMPIELFSETIGELARIASEAFAASIGLSNAKEIPEKFGLLVSPTIVSAFNAVLPNGYPYLAAIVICPNSTRIGCIKREKIPGSHDIVSKNICPIISLEIEAPNGQSAIKQLQIDEVSFSDNATLPEL